MITEATIHPGSLVRVGQKLGELMNTNNYELEATVRLANLNYIKVGSQVTLYSDDTEGLGTHWTCYYIDKATHFINSAGDGEVRCI